MRASYIRNAGGPTASVPLTYAATTNGAAFPLTHMIGYSITCAAVETVAALAGTLKLQCSNNAFTDNTGIDEASDALWVDIPGSSQAVAGSGNFVWNVADCFYNAVRVVWTRTTGTGTFDIIKTARGPQS